MEVNGLEKLNNEITFDQLLYGQTFIVSDKKSSYVAMYMKCVKSIGGKDTEYGVNIETGTTHYFGSGTVVKPVVATLNVPGISDKCLVSHDDNVSYRYLLSYTFIKKRPDHPMINDIGNGRLILDYKKENRNQ